MDYIGRKKFCCKYPGCNNWYYSNTSTDFVNKHFFKFPRGDRQEAWKNACKIDFPINPSSWRICEDHFRDADFVNQRKERLNFNAVPISLVNEGVSQVESSSFSYEINGTSHSAICICHQPSSSLIKCPLHFSDLQDSAISNEVIEYSAFDNFILDHNYCGNPQNNQFVNIFYEHDYCGAMTDYDLDKDSQDHNNITSLHNEIPVNLNKFDFLTENSNKSGILSKIGLSVKELTPRKAKMYEINRNLKSKMCKLTKLLEKERDKVKTLQTLCDSGKFKFIDEHLNSVNKDFINSQIRNSSQKPHARRWTDQDKAFALALYKKSPRVYKFLQIHFQLPSSRTLKGLLSNIQFETGVNPGILRHLKNQVAKMKAPDRFCSLLFDEISLSGGFHYEKVKQYISGYEDLGSLGRTNRAANHALVFMVRGVRRQWKQVIAYYFTSHTVSAENLRFLIIEIILQLQEVGLTVVATVCDQGPTNGAAVNQLCGKNPYYFYVNKYRIVTIYDVPHLLKITRNALLKCKIEFAPHKCAKFEHIKNVFDFDQRKTFKSLPKLKEEHFNFADSYVKMKVKVAAAQLSSSMASAIETYIALEVLEPEAIFTAEFVHKIDTLFDSLNSSSSQVCDHKIFKSALHKGSPHLTFWSELLEELGHWKLIHLTKKTDVTNRYYFVDGWQTIMIIWFLFCKNIEKQKLLNNNTYISDL
ncbi:hypothetical protein Zmor_020561 [Zophobas morio]|uniref:THAP-type domain-containing protein n=2 Tax=Zophobas morio TaxID=2755281 RepID=A0AA38M9S2_9CUCU|nr:hypothetical protein Zmor_020561 [Zophobas morio]